MWLSAWLVGTWVMVFSAGEKVEVELGPSRTSFELLSKGYPEPAAPLLHQSWTVTSPEGTKIILTCFDIRLYLSPKCTMDLMVVDEGKGSVEKLCGSHYNRDFSSAGNRMDVRLTTGSYLSGGVRCLAEISKKDLEPPGNSGPADEPEEIFDLEVGGEAVTVRSPDYPAHVKAHVKKSWGFRVPEGARIRLLFTDLRLHNLRDGCGDYGVKIIDGAKVIELCGSNNGFTMLSSGEILKLELNTGDNSDGGMEVEARGREMGVYGEVTTPVPPPYKGIESEEIDSSEHGGPEGKKGTTCPCGWTNKESARIVGGRETIVNEYPFMAALVFRGERYSFCGASIITHQHALTAAHCTNGTAAKYISIVIGEHDQSRDDETDLTEQIPVARIIQHENYRRSILKHDISILVLEKPIEFTQFIGPVCLSRLQKDLTRQYVRNIGWGTISFEGAASIVLRKVDTRIVHIGTCNKRFPSRVSADKPTQICTYSHEKASCHGDSGGPMIWLDPETNRYTQRGITSWGTICATVDPSVKTDVSAYINWIEKQIADTYPSENLCFKQGE